MHSFRVFFLIVSFISSALFAESLSVITDQADSAIYINGVYIGNENIYNHDVQPGSYHVKVINQELTVFSQVVEIKNGEIKTVDTLNFNTVPKSNLYDKGPAALAAKRLRDIKGNIGIGYQLGYVSGLSINTLFYRIRTGFMGWKVASNEDYQYEFRFSFGIKDKIPVLDKLSTLYLGAGIGEKKVKGTDDAFTEILLGLDLPARYGFWNLEFGYGFIQDNATESYREGILTKVGYHYFF